MARFLSARWLAELEAAAKESERLRQAASEIDITLGHLVRGAPEGDLRWTVRLADGDVTVATGGDAADVDVIQDYETAVAISRGEVSPAAAFAAGRIKLGGRVGLLVGRGDVVAGLDDAFAGVRATTEY